MKQFILLIFIITCKLASTKHKHEINIDHGDSHKTNIFVSDDGTINVYTHQEHEGGLYYTENRETGVKVRYLLPIKTTKEDSTLSQDTKISSDGKYVSFRYSTAKKETREEEFKMNDSGKIKVTGSFSYIDPNGNNYLQGYEADENGYRTKVSFGTKIKYDYSGVKSVTPARPPGVKRIDGALLCSLGGGGCRK